MKFLAVLIILLSFSSVSALCQNSGKGSEDGYIDVAAKKRVTKDDGSVTYRDYELFKTRTVGLLPGFQKQAGTVTTRALWWKN